MATLQPGAGNHDWMALKAQHEWLTQTSFDEIKPGLKIWITTKRQDELGFESEESEPYATFSLPLADGLHLSLVVEVPELADSSEMRMRVTNSAVSAWKLSAEDVVEAARQVLRRLPPPIWETRTEHLQGANGAGAVVTVHAASAVFGVDMPVSAWSLLLDEVLPEPLPWGAFVAIPERNSLILTPAPEPQANAWKAVWWALERATELAAATADYRDHVTSKLFAFPSRTSMTRFAFGGTRGFMNFDVFSRAEPGPAAS